MVLTGQKNRWQVEGVPWKEGGNSYIYLAHREGVSNELYALKLFKEEIRRDNQRNRFLQEIQILQRLIGVEGCVQYVDHGFIGNTPFVVAVLYEGGNFYERYLKTTNVDKPPAILTKFIALLKIIKRLHGSQPKLAVRDIKPQNIFLTKDLDPIMGDFGLSLFSDCPEEERLTVISQIGSQGYRPPKWTERYPPSDHTPGDIWSLGRTLWAICARKNPPMTFEPLYGENHLKHSMPIREANLFQGLVNFCLEPDPSKRADIDELISESVETLKILESDPAQSSNEDLEKYFAELNSLAKGSSLRHIGKKKEELRAAKEDELNGARDLFAAEFQRLHSMIQSGISREVGTISLINQFGTGSNGVDSPSGAVQIGVIFSPSSEHSAGGASHVQFTAQMGYDRMGQLYYLEQRTAPGISEISEVIKPRSFLAFATKKVSSCQGTIFSWFLPAIKSQFEK